MIDLRTAIFMIVVGVLFIIFPKGIVHVLGKLEWKIWKAFVHDDSDSFKQIFINKRSNVLRVAGFVMIFAVIADYVLRNMI